MPFYEIIYETGNNSIASYENDEEAMSAVKAHHERAKQGQAAQASNPEMGPAERIARVLKYDEHPATYMESQAVKAGEVQAVVNAAAVGDLVSVPEIAAAVRDITSPVVSGDAHDSNYKMPEVDELSGWDE
jgi:hypothetical protein